MPRVRWFKGLTATLLDSGSPHQAAFQQQRCSPSSPCNPPVTPSLSASLLQLMIRSDPTDLSNNSSTRQCLQHRPAASLDSNLSLAFCRTPCAHGFGEADTSHSFRRKTDSSCRLPPAACGRQQPWQSPAGPFCLYFATPPITTAERLRRLSSPFSIASPRPAVNLPPSVNISLRSTTVIRHLSTATVSGLFVHEMEIFDLSGTVFFYYLFGFAFAFGVPSNSFIGPFIAFPLRHRYWSFWMVSGRVLDRRRCDAAAVGRSTVSIWRLGSRPNWANGRRRRSRLQLDLGNGKRRHHVRQRAD